METPDELKERLHQQGIEVDDEAARAVLRYVTDQRRVLAQVLARLGGSEIT
ncbi:MAG TPA: hypothetical protein QGF63_15095 [Alphaproteobacteria bacterium]|jgi:DNA polymerase III delta subunit|nr:hypothetical protein [Alphaproteobacteria bacterium]MDP6269806.1 hypothetical protein [Alphaproteobacteria bacterium]MDP7165013.1 hypothetical protein [Alphaproteobacteria bacterium]MDP7429192.1 hypothetical protein [Alphaproteobacteria bacterium]HJM51157.1 hypothetical protein [Alphaproteobacteria bacterium]